MSEVLVTVLGSVEDDLRRRGEAFQQARKALADAMTALYAQVEVAEAFGVSRATVADAARLRREGLHRRVSARPTPKVPTPQGIHVRDGVLYPRNLSASDAAAARRHLAAIRRARTVLDLRSDAVLHARSELVTAIRVGQEAGLSLRQIAEITGLPRHSPRHLATYEPHM